MSGMEDEAEEKIEARDPAPRPRQSLRRATIYPTLGREGQTIIRNCYQGRGIAVFTSGGDAQGMNAAVRAVVRMGIYVGCKVYFIKEGYQGMVDGGDNIVEAKWSDVSGIMQIGGTVIGSARCSDFRERPGRLKAAENLVHNGISNLVVIGGDGSLTGANLFRQEWDSLLKELLDTKRITEEEWKKYEHLHIVGLVGSIDNDFCGTDMTIGTDSALHRIIEACDAIVTTAASHQRAFVLEVMGRHCGYLALVAALASEADWVFIPECPPDEDWKDKLCKKLSTERTMGQRVNIIIVAEGAIDRQLNPITPELVKNLIVERLGFDTRLTVLGHVQRGGSPSAFDRLLGCRMGAEAVLALMDTEAGAPACVISLDGNQAVRVPLTMCVEKTRAVCEAMKNQDFEQAITLRGRSFNNNLSVYLKLSKLKPPESSLQGLWRRLMTIDAAHRRLLKQSGLRLAVLNVGAPACGVNACIRSFVRLALTKGYTVQGVRSGFRGLMSNNVAPLKWMDVRGWSAEGGSCLGTQRASVKDIGLDKVAKKLEEYKLSGLLVIGGFEAFQSVLTMAENRDKYPAFRIPMVVIPATISNNIPGTDFSIGADSALNEITQMVDKIKQSAKGSTRRVFVVETMGAHCGYLATLSGLAGGADAAYIFEETLTIDRLREDCAHLRSKIEGNVKRGLILCSDKANPNYDTNFITRLFSEEGEGVFDCRSNVLGHVQQGGVPTPFDRNMGTKMGAKAIDFLDECVQEHIKEDGHVETDEPKTAALLGLVKRSTIFTPITELREETDFKNRIPNEEWWMCLRPLMRIMAKHDSYYKSEMDDVFS